MRLLALALLSATLMPAAEGEAGPKPMPRPNPQAQSIPIQLPPGPKFQSTFRIIGIDAKGPTAAGQKVLDDLLADGWTVRGVSSLSGGSEADAKIVVWAAKPQQPAAPAPAPKP